MIKRHYGYYESPIGVLEIITSDDAVVSILFIEEMKENLAESDFLRETIRQVDEYFKGKRKIFDLKVELHGTEFQKTVWTKLLEIPFGQIVSYKDISKRLGNEKAVRAVGGANSKNQISIIIPCHRVIGANKNLIGYSGGIERKQWLLDHEKEITILEEIL